MSKAAERGEAITPVRRENFGPGRSGEIDFFLISSGESFVGEDRSLCGKPAIRVLDFDSATSTEQLPVCGDACELSARALIIADDAKRGKTPAMGINGWGRS
jgi:hypothetical protein